MLINNFSKTIQYDMTGGRRWAAGQMARLKKGLNSIIILVALSLWNPRNRCVFDGLQPNLNGILGKKIAYMGRRWGTRNCSPPRPASCWLGLEAIFGQVVVIYIGHNVLSVLWFSQDFPLKLVYLLGASPIFFFFFFFLMCWYAALLRVQEKKHQKAWKKNCTT